MSAVKRDLEHCVGGGCGREEAPAKRSRRAECSNDAAFEEVLSPAQYSRDLGHLKSLQRLNAAYDQGLKYVQYRGLLVSFVMDVCAEFKLMKITMHRSLNYLDRLLSKHTHISRQCYQLVATACILVAAKFEEQPQNVPAMSDLLQANIVGVGHDNKSTLINAETMLLETLDWNAHSATLLHFSQCYVSKGVLFLHDTIDGLSVNSEDQSVIVRCIEFIATLCLEEYSFLSYDQSLAAAAGVAAARRFCRVSPVWPDELAEMSGFSAEDIGDCFEAIQKILATYPDVEKGYDANASPRTSTSYFFGDPTAKDDDA